MIADPSDLLPNGTTTGLLGVVMAAIVGGILWLRRFLSSDNLGRGADAAQLAVIAMLNAQLASEQTRNERLQTALDNSTTQIDGLRKQIFDLTIEVQQLRKQFQVSP